MKELREKIPTRPGTGYLEVKLKRFDVQPWPFILYMAYNTPEELKCALECYLDYDGAENYQVIMEQLREEYVGFRVLEEIKKGNGKRNV